MRYFVAVAVVAGGVGAADAQGPGLPRPATSPYLNLLRNGNPTFLNYYGLVRPEQQLRASAANLQQQVTAVNQSTQNVYSLLGEQGVVTTDAPAGFFTHRAYFQTAGSTGGGGISTLRPIAGGVAAPRTAVPRRR